MLYITPLNGESVEITQLGDEAYLAYQYQLEDTRPEPTAALGDADFYIGEPPY
jgi:hypothetical protein